jgi:uncharacterized protein involved in cysteine biosynthesis
LFPGCGRGSSTRIKALFLIKAIPSKPKEASTIAFQRIKETVVSKLSLIFQAIKKIFDQVNVIIKALLKRPHHVAAHVNQSIIIIINIVVVVVVVFFVATILSGFVCRLQRAILY